MYYVMRASAPSLHRESVDTCTCNNVHIAHEYNVNTLLFIAWDYSDLCPLECQVSY